MKQTWTLLGWLTILGSISTPAFADSGPTTCSRATMRGTWAYGYAASDNGAPYSSSGRESYDGQGNLKYYQLWNEGGVTYTYTGTGTYKISADCVATVVYDGGAAWTFFVAPDGSAYYWNNNLNVGVSAGGRVDHISAAQLLR